MRNPYLYSFIALNLFFLNNACSQSSITDSSFYRSAIAHIIQLYTDSVKENLRLYNGTEFTGAYSNNSGHPFFEYREPQKGDVFYDGIHYPDVLLSYDITRDEIIFINPFKNLNIKLLAQKINWFTIQNHLFINVHEDSVNAGFPGSGFYELLYEGAGSVLAKRRKQLYQSPKADEVSKFIQWIEYYVRKDSVYYTISGKRSLLVVCRDHKIEVAKFMKKENLNFKKDPANTIIKVIDYYTQLKNN
jgi:hypothetical protein